jgi:hypothetical protein
MTVLQATMTDASKLPGFWFGSPLVCGYLRRDRCSARAILARLPWLSAHAPQLRNTPERFLASAAERQQQWGAATATVSTRSASSARATEHLVGSIPGPECSFDEDEAAE